VRGSIRSAIERFRQITPCFCPTGAWRYDGGKRDLRLDLLRGFAVIAMVADHIGGERSWLYAITGGDAFFVSAAEVFVFISGLLMGIISAAVVARQGLGAALMKILHRAWTLYLMTVTLTLIFMALSTQWGLGWGTAATESTWPELMVSVLTLHRTMYLTDVLLLYTFLVLMAVPVLILLVHAQTAIVLTGSWALWCLWQLTPQHAQIPWTIADNSVFNFPAWQVLFVTALAIGYHRHRLEALCAQVAERTVLSVAGVIVAAAITTYIVLRLPTSASYAVLADQLFGKVDLRLGRLLVFGGFFIFAYMSLTLAWAPIRRALGWLLLPLGQDALSAYILHLFVVALAVKLRPVIFGTSAATPAENTAFQLAGIACIWLAIRLHPLALPQLRIGFTRATALLAAGYAHLYVPGHPSRDG
jgi:hypothetical protein